MGRVGTILKRAFYTLWDDPTAKMIARRELEEAKRSLLSNQTAAEYHAQMNVVYRNKIKRLEEFLSVEEKV